MRKIGSLSAFLVAIAFAPAVQVLAGDGAAPDRSVETAEQIRIEACRPTNDAAGHPLPLGK